MIPNHPWADAVPIGWNLVPARTMARPTDTSVSDSDGTVTVFRDGQVTLRRLRRTDGFTEALKEIGYHGIKTGELAIHSMDAFAGAMGISEADGKVSPVVHTYSVDQDDVRYVNWQLKALSSTGYIQSLAKGIRERSTAFGPREFRRLPMLRPPLEFQRSVADFLDRETAQMDALIAAQEDLVAKLIHRRGSALKHLVTHGVSGEDAYPSVRCRYLCRIQTGSGDTVDATEDGPYPFYVRSETALRHDKFEFNGPAVLTAGDGAGVGKIYHYVVGPFMAHQRVYVLDQFNHLSPRFFYYAFSAYFGERALDGSAKSTVHSVRRSMLTDLQLPVPPAREQAAIVDRLDETTSHMDRIIAAARESIGLLRERRVSVITAAVTGRLDPITGIEVSATELELV